MNEESEQIDSRLNVEVGRDQPLSPSKLDAAILSALPSGVAKRATVEIEGKNYPYIAYHTSKGKHAILSAAVTFLGGNGKFFRSVPLQWKRGLCRFCYCYLYATQDA